MAAFVGAYPDIRQHLYDEGGALRSFINIYVGENNVKDVSGLDTPVRDGETILIVPAIAGGNGAPGGYDANPNSVRPRQ